MTFEVPYLSSRWATVGPRRVVGRGSAAREGSDDSNVNVIGIGLERERGARAAAGERLRGRRLVASPRAVVGDRVRPPDERRAGRREGVERDEGRLATVDRARARLAASLVARAIDPSRAGHATLAFDFDVKVGLAGDAGAAPEERDESRDGKRRAGSCGVEHDRGRRNPYAMSASARFAPRRGWPVSPIAPRAPCGRASCPRRCLATTDHRQSTCGPHTVVLDAGALIAFERGDARMRALVREALKTGVRLVIPAGALGQVWRGTARQAPLRALVKDRPRSSRARSGARRSGGGPLRARRQPPTSSSCCPSSGDACST